MQSVSCYYNSNIFGETNSTIINDSLISMTGNNHSGPCTQWNATASQYYPDLSPAKYPWISFQLKCVSSFVETTREAFQGLSHFTVQFTNKDCSQSTLTGIYNNHSIGGCIPWYDTAPAARLMPTLNGFELIRYTDDDCVQVNSDPVVPIPVLSKQGNCVFLSDYSSIYIYQ